MTTPDIAERLRRYGLNDIVEFVERQASEVERLRAQVVPDVDALAQHIRRVNGNNSMGAGVLAESILDWLASATQQAEPLMLNGLTESETSATASVAGLVRPSSTVEDGKWEGAEEWMPLAWDLCANECGEEACSELIWEGGTIPEPWGDRWLKYEDQAKEMIAMVRKHVPTPTVPEAMKVVTAALIADPDYAWSWHCNITMAQVDEGNDHAIAEHGAQRFLSLLTGQTLTPAHPLRPKPAAQAEPVAPVIEDAQRLWSAAEFLRAVWSQSGWTDDQISERKFKVAYELEQIGNRLAATSNQPAQAEPVVTYVSAMGQAADNYINKLGGRSSTLPATFRWEDCLAAMLAAAPSHQPAQGVGELPSAAEFLAARHQVCSDEWMRGFDAARAAIAQAPEAEPNADALDATRYRWLRENPTEYKLTQKDGYGGRELLGWEELDAAIDAALAHAQKEQP